MLLWHLGCGGRRWNLPVAPPWLPSGPSNQWKREPKVGRELLGTSGNGNPLSLLPSFLDTNKIKAQVLKEKGKKKTKSNKISKAKQAARP